MHFKSNFASAATLVAISLGLSLTESDADWNASIADSNPLNWYRLDELTGSIAVDYGSQGLDAIYGQGVQAPTRGTTGLVGDGVTFDGDQDTIFIDGADLTGNWTAEFIVKKEFASGRSSILIRGRPFECPATGLKLEQHATPDEIGYTQFCVADYLFQPAVPSLLDEFMHLVFVKNPTSVKVYVNGTLAGSGSNTISLSRYQLGDEIGESPFAILDEVVLYNRALPESEIAKHFLAISGAVIVDHLTLLKGFHRDGTISDTYFSDNLYLRYFSSPPFSPILPSIEVLVEGTLPTDDPQTLSFSVESATNTTGVTQTIELFNYSNGGFEVVDIRNTTFTDSLVVYEADGDVSRFVEPGTGIVKARLAYFEDGSTFLLFWTVRFDQIGWSFSNF